jgi:ParB-like chromosome segregation protein Spo0J
METEIEMRVHPLAAAFPPLEGEEFDQLVESIRKHGQRESIVLYEGMILDGRNRARACKAAGIVPDGVEFEGTYEQARDFVIDANINRRHLDVSQRAMVAGRLANMRQGERTDLQPPANLPKVTEPQAPTSISQAPAAERLNVSERSVRDAHKVIDKGAPELARAVDRGEVSVSRAAKIADLPKAEQVRRMAEPASPPRPSFQLGREPLRTFENLAAGDLVGWLRDTSPREWSRLPRMLRMAADIIEVELKDKGRAA